jgi:uncharacterized membrane protein YdfJ with MMPL/SSD domain
MGLDVAKALGTNGWGLYFSGREASMLSVNKDILKTMMLGENVGCIFIVLLFGWQIRSWRLTLIPLLNTCICLVVADALLYPISKSGIIVLPSFVPNVCLFLAIALSVDYSFFHLSRFQEVRCQGGNLIEAVTEMVATGGRVVLVSGVVLMFCWLALAAFPVFGVDSLGYSASITIFVCIAVNLTMNPAMVLVFPVFFSNAAQDPWHCCRRHRRDVHQHGTFLAQANTGNEPSLNMYGKIAKRITTCPGMLLVPILVYAVFIPIALRLFGANFVVGGLDGNSAATNSASHLILEDFPGHGGGVPLTVMLTPPRFNQCQKRCLLQCWLRACWPSPAEDKYPDQCL